MSWNQEELLKQVDNYFDNKTKEEIIQDLKDTNSLQYLEDVSDES